MQAVANQIRTIARHRFTKRVGRLSTAEIDAVNRGVEIQLGLLREPWYAKDEPPLTRRCSTPRILP